MMCLESLANEVLLELFEFIDGIDLLRSFIDLNTRFNQLLYRHYRRYQLDFQSLSKDHFDRICDQHLPIIVDQIISLRLSDDETPNLSQLLFSRSFTLDRCLRLQSLSLLNICSLDLIHQIISQCRYLLHLTDLHINKQNNNSRQESDNAIELFNSIWSLAKLRHCNLSGIQTDEQFLRRISTISFSIRSLSIENIPCNLQCLSHVYKHTPCLEHLSVTIYSYSFDDRLTSTMPSIKSIKLVFGGLVDSMNHLFENIPNLSRLMITTSLVNFDGHQWEELISQHLSQLRRFQLKMILEYGENNQDIEEMIQELMHSFQSSFWLEEHQWYVRCHWHPSDPYKCLTLYTLPYAFPTFDYSNKSSTRSTCLDQQQYWSYDRVRIFTHGNIENTSLDSINLPHARFPYLHHLYLNLPFDDQFWSHFPSFHHLTSLHVSLYRYSGYDQLQRLFHQAPHLYSVKIESFIGVPIKLFQLKSESIRRFDLIDDQSVYYSKEYCLMLSNSSLGKQCEVLLLRIKQRVTVLDLIEHMSNLRLLIFRCEDSTPNHFSLSNEELIQWLQHHLPATYIITGDTKPIAHIRIWIDRETKKHQIFSSNHHNKLSQVLTSFRRLFSQNTFVFLRITRVFSSREE